MKMWSGDVSIQIIAPILRVEADLYSPFLWKDKTSIALLAVCQFPAACILQYV